MKQLKKLAFALAAVAATAGAWAEGEEYTQTVGGLTWKYKLTPSEKYTTIIAVSPKPTGALTIPSSLGGKPVYEIRWNVFENCTGLTSVKIPDSVEVIEASAFEGCTKLASVVVPEGVSWIDKEAFSGCTSLSSVTLPDSLAYLGLNAFSGCNDALFDTTSIPGVTLVDGWAIDSDRDSLSGVLDLAGVRGIAAYAFKGCQGITGVKIPSGVTAIGEYAFASCSGLKSVWIPKSVAAIYDGAFGSRVRSIVYYVEKGDTNRVRRMLFETIYPEDEEMEDWDFDPQIIETTTCKLTLKSVNTKYGTVSGGGKYNPGAMVTIKAKAKSGYVFAGWYTDKACKTKLNPPGYDNRKPTVKIEMPPQKTTVYARFVTKAADKSKLGLTSATKKLATTAAKATAGKNFELKLGIYSYSLMTVTAKSLPKGLSIDKTTGTISGTPTKPGSYTATVTVATAAGNKLTFKVKVKVSNYTWSKGTFNGYAFPDGGDKLGGYLTFTVGSTGKISGKVTYKGKAYPFTSQYSSCSSSKAKFKLPAMKLGSKSVAAVYLTVTPKQARIEGESVVEATDAGAIYVAQKAFESVGGMYGKSYSFDSADTGSGLKNGDSIKVTWKGKVVKISGKVNGKSLAVGSVPLFLSSKEVVDWDSSYKFSVYICDSASGYSAWLFFFVETDSLGDLVSDKAILQK